MSVKLFSDFSATAKDLLDTLSKQKLRPDNKKVLRRCFKLVDAARLLDLSESYLRKLEAEGKLPKRCVHEGASYPSWSLEQINEIRDVLNRNPYRVLETDSAVRIQILNFKGGVAKTTSTLYLGQYLALKGYRVLLVDLDPQASLTSQFFVDPDEYIQDDNGDEVPKFKTLAPFLCGDVASLEDAENSQPFVYKTHWPRLDIIPSNLGLNRAEFELPSMQARDNTFEFWSLLDKGLSSIEHDYDIIIMDTPPSLSYVTINGVWAATAMIVPIPPAILDLSSARQFFEMLSQVLEPIQNSSGIIKEYDFIRLLISKFDGQAHSREIAGWIRKLWGTYALDHHMANTTVINAAGVEMTTVYEMQKYDGNNATFKRARELLDGVNSEIEQQIRLCWPSQHEAAQKSVVL